MAADARFREWAETVEPLEELGELLPFGAEEKVADSEPVTLLAFGDMMLGRYVWTLMQRNGNDYPFVYFPELVESMLTEEDGTLGAYPDFIFANLEGPISDSSYVNPGTAMIFNFKPEVTETIKKYGINLLSLSNNHAYDMGESGATQTRQYLTEAGIHHFGDARSIREETVWSTEVDGTSLSFVGLNDTVLDHLDYEAATEIIRGLEETADFTLVSIHWGVEYRTTPLDEQVEWAHAFIDAGADIILGHHPHVIAYADPATAQIAEWYEGPNGARPIYYSLGNFIFDQYFQDNVQEGLGLKITLKKSLEEGGQDTVEVEETVFDITKSQVVERVD